MTGERFDNEMLARVARAVPQDDVIFTLAQSRPNRVAMIDSSGVYVETGRSEAHGTGPQLVPAWMIITAWGHLRRSGRLSQDELLNDLNVKRSALVCGLVALFPEVEVESTRPTVLRLRRGVEANPAAESITAANDGTGLERLTACGCPIFSRGWSGGMSVLVDEAGATGRPHDAKVARIRERWREPEWCSLVE